MHNGNISAFTQIGQIGSDALTLKANKSTTYTKTEVDISLALKQHKLDCFGIDRHNGLFRVVADDLKVRSIGGVGPISITEVMDFLSGGVLIICKLI